MARKREPPAAPPAPADELAKARGTWIVVNRTWVYLDPNALAEGELRLADRDVATELCAGCGEEILGTGSAKFRSAELRILCSCGAEYTIERA